MILSLSMFFVYQSPFPLYVGAIFLLSGMTCLWATRYTFKFYPIWGRKYYKFSSIIRPVGIILISWAWVEILAVRNVPHVPWAPLFNTFFIFFIFFVFLFDHLLRKILIGMLLLIALLASSFFFGDGRIPLSLPLFGFLISSVWMVGSIFNLGLRRSLLFASATDPLIESGFYSQHRHPQLLSTTIVVLSANYLFTPLGGLTEDILFFRNIHLLMMMFAIICVITFEDQDLQKRFGSLFNDYKKQLPGILITLRSPRKIDPLAVLGLIGCYFLFIFIVMKFQPGINLGHTFFVSLNSRYEATSAIRFNAVKNLGWRLYKNMVPDLQEKQPELTPELLDLFKREMENKNIIEPYPMTLFFCNHKYDVTIANIHPGQTAVESLPFPLVCEENYFEFALAYDYDADSFPQIYLWTVHYTQKNITFPEIEIHFASNDNINWLQEEFAVR